MNLKRINGSHYKNMIDFGVRNLEAHCAEVNALNVFPVPDGDTGTNMVLTLKNGLKSTADKTDFLPKFGKKFGNAVVMGARGNSGVITSQFFKGVSDTFGDNTEVDIPLFIKAFENGVRLAYESVAHPVQGTILTVLDDSLSALKENSDNINDFEDLSRVLAVASSRSLENTPNLLVVLKKAGVVDSGGAGITYFFRGVQKYFRGESPDAVQETQYIEDNTYVDYSIYNTESSFEYGYCTEVLLQLLNQKERFVYNDFKKVLKTMGGSLVISAENSKVKIHIHTRNPENVMMFCHRFGEFLSVKVENMTIQHNQTTQKYLYTPQTEKCSFAIVALATDKAMQKLFSKMGADVAILSKDAPSANEFIEAFKLVSNKEILVFPNSSNYIMSAVQAASIYTDAKVTVIDCNSMAKCYSSLAIVDFDETDVEMVKETINETILGLRVVKISKAAKNVDFDNKAIRKDDFFAFHKDDILEINSSAEDLALKVIGKFSKDKGLSVITLFCGVSVPDEQKDKIVKEIKDKYSSVDVSAISTEDSVYHIILLLE